MNAKVVGDIVIVRFYLIALNIYYRSKNMKSKYFIREVWKISGTIDEYNEETNPISNVVNSLKAVREFIKDWIETWQENANENEYRFLNFKTDYKTFAKCKIKTGEFYGRSLVDTFSLKVKKDKR